MRGLGILGEMYGALHAKNRQGHASLERYLGDMHTNKVALITGANKGIGHAIASELAARGFTVLVGARDATRGEAAVKRIAGDARASALDVTCADSIAAAAARIRRELGRLDVLVNNAGIAAGGAARKATLADIRRGGAPSAASLDEVRAVFETNVFGVIAVTQAMLPLLREGPAGRIVNVTSRIGSLTAITDPAFSHAWDWRRRLRALEDRPQCNNRRVRTRARRHLHQGEPGVPWLHRDRLERPQRIADGRRSGARAGAPRAAWARRTHRVILERRRLDPVVNPRGLVAPCRGAQIVAERRRIVPSGAPGLPSARWNERRTID